MTDKPNTAEPQKPRGRWFQFRLRKPPAGSSRPSDQVLCEIIDACRAYLRDQEAAPVKNTDGCKEFADTTMMVLRFVLGQLGENEADSLFAKLLASLLANYRDNEQRRRASGK